MKQRWLWRTKLVLVTIGVLTVSTFAPFLTSMANAATLNATLVKFDRHLAATVVTWQACFKAGTNSSISTVAVTFPDSFTIDTTAGHYTPSSSSNMIAGITSTALASIAVSGTPSNTNGSKNVTFSFTAVGSPTTTTLYCFAGDTNSADGGVTTPAAGNNITGSITLSNGDSGSWGTSMVNGTSNYDQWTVGAVVPQLFTYTGPGTNTDNFSSNLDPLSTISTSGKTVNIKTNAPNGYYVWAKDLNTGIRSTVRSYTIAATTPGSNVASCPTGTESYTTFVTPTVGTAGGTGTPTTPAAYGTNCGSGLNTTFAVIGTSSGTSNGDNYAIVEKANISNGTPAASDYSDTITVVAAGVF